MLTPDGSLLFILILFLVLVPILNNMLFKPITRVLDERERLTSGSSTDARAILHRIDNRLAEYEEGIRGARSEGYRAIEARRAEANAERQRKLDAARADADARIGAARDQLAADAAEARSRLEADAREIADGISATLLGRAVGGGR
jgi:F-type H+-transporting ATPase subunit b